MKKFTALAAGAVLAFSATVAHAQSVDYVLNTRIDGRNLSPGRNGHFDSFKGKAASETEVQLDRRELRRFGCECAGAGRRYR